MVFNNRYLSSVLVTFQFLTSLQYAHAVCASGQMAVGTDETIHTGPGPQFSSFQGFLMANNCGIISTNGISEASNQVCNGGYSQGASVTCSGNQPIAAVDTAGQDWTCSTTSDSSCNAGLPNIRTVVACCNRS